MEKWGIYRKEKGKSGRGWWKNGAYIARKKGELGRNGEIRKGKRISGKTKKGLIKYYRKMD